MLESSLASQLVDKGKKMVDVCEKFKLPRVNKIQKAEKIYLQDRKPVIPGMLDIPMDKVFLSGFVDTLLAKTDDKPTLTYEHGDLADLKRAKKVTAAWQKESAEDKADWASHDRDAKKSAVFSGIGTFKIWAEKPYQHYLDTIDYLDWIFEPMGGKYIENHLFNGEDNIFKTKHDLVEGAKAGIYDKKQVAILINSYSNGEHKVLNDQYQQRMKRFQDLGLDVESNSYVGEKLYNLTELILNHNGKRYYLLFDRMSGVWVRASEWSVMNKSGLYPYVFFQTNEDKKNVLSKAPVDDVLPVAEMVRILWNETINNLRKRNWNMRAYDNSIFPDPSELEWRPNGLVAVNGKKLSASGRSVQSGVYEFQTPDTTGITVNLMEYVDRFLGQKTGITAGIQGASDDDAKVGIYYGNLQQIADRLGLYNKSYSRAWTQLGKRYYHNLKENLTEKMLVRIIGEKGVDEEEITKDDLKPNQDFDVKVIGGSAQVQLDEVKKKQRKEALDALLNSPFSQNLNPDMVIEYVLRSGNYEEDEIRAFMNVDSYANQELLSEASQAIQEILKGKVPDLNRGANIAFLQKITDYIADTNSLTDRQIQALQAYAQAHIDQGIVVENMQQQVNEQQIQASKMLNVEQTPNVIEPNVPIPNTRGGTQSRSAEMTNQLQPVI